VVSPQPIAVAVVLVHGRDSAVAGGALFDLLDYSAAVDPAEVAVGTLAPAHARLGARPPFTIQCQVIGTIRAELTQPRAMIAPFGEHWTVRIDGRSCTVAAGTEATAGCALAAVLRRVAPPAGDIDARVGIQTVQRAATAFVEAVEHERALPRAGIVQAAKEFHYRVQEWIDPLLS
jgi:hypothetical protein